METGCVGLNLESKFFPRVKERIMKKYDKLQTRLNDVIHDIYQSFFACKVTEVFVAKVLCVLAQILLQ